MVRELRTLLIVLFLGIVLMNVGFALTFKQVIVRDYSDEEIRMRAIDLGMMDLKDALGE